jgi:hypothetical protein
MTAKGSVHDHLYHIGFAVFDQLITAFPTLSSCDDQILDSLHYPYCENRAGAGEEARESNSVFIVGGDNVIFMMTCRILSFLASCLFAFVPLCLRASMPLCLRASIPLCLRASMPLCLRASMPLCLDTSIFF